MQELSCEYAACIHTASYKQAMRYLICYTHAEAKHFQNFSHQFIFIADQLRCLVTKGYI